MKATAKPFLPRTPLAVLIGSGIAAWGALGAAVTEEKDAKESGKPAQAKEAAPKIGEGRPRPPGGNGAMFYRVFVSRNDKNGDGVIEKGEFRGSEARFDQMDANKNGKLDRAEIDALHRSRVADPLSMRQRIERGEARRPPFAVPPEPAKGPQEGEAAQQEGEPSALTPLGTRITAKQAFARLDVDKNDKVTATEFRRSPGMADAKKAQEVVSKIDQNNDGSLSFEEFNIVFAKRHEKRGAVQPAGGEKAP